MFGTIYSIRLKATPSEVLYVGSTCDLDKRKRHHYSDCYNSRHNNFNMPLYEYIRNNNINFRDDCIFEIEDEIRQEMEEDDNVFRKRLKQSEEEFMEQLKPKCNKNRAYDGREKKEYYKEYWERNKEKLKEKLNEKFVCETCGGKYTRANKSHHLKSNKHQHSLQQAKIIFNVNNSNNITVNLPK